MVLSQWFGTKKLKMHKILTLAISALLVLDATATYLCHVCRSVREDNTCAHRPRTCAAGMSRFCFTQRIIRSRILLVSRGCTSTCRNVRTKYRELQMQCCEENLCNYHNRKK
ncbi:uncharacterized protein LOC143822196 [Paroedura picta]|uniref:uncharacterized protein LOC143822196 n=1 Tax=Paroedura picta TaxID=143630 RepID=UPI0040579C77